MTAVLLAAPFVPSIAGVAAVVAFVWFTRYRPEHRAQWRRGYVH